MGSLSLKSEVSVFILSLVILLLLLGGKTSEIKVLLYGLGLRSEGILGVNHSSLHSRSSFLLALVI